MAKRNGIYAAVGVVSSIFLILVGCKKSIPTEISEQYFNSELNKFEITLNTYDMPIKDSTSIYETNVGSDDYDSLVKRVESTNTYESSKSIKYEYELSSGESISKLRATSIADQTPAIYLMQGNVRYKTGKCSNVCALEGKNVSNITISNCVFENMSGINLYNCSNVTIENCYFKGAENGIHMTKSSNIYIVNCTFEMNGTGLTDYYQGIYLGDGNDTVNATNCYFKASNDIKKPYRVGSTSNDEESSTNITFDNCFSIGHFRSGFQNIDGYVSLKNCTFIFDEYVDSYDGAIIIDAGSDKTYTTLKNCNFYASYRKKISTSSTTRFDECSFGLFSS